MIDRGPETVVAIYRVRPERLDDFQLLLRRHVPTLRRLGLVTADPPVFYRGEEDGGGPIVFEIFTWRDAAAVESAHHSPEVMEIWGAIESMTESRDGRPNFEFPHVQRFEP